MNNEPVAIRYDFDGYGYQYMDSGSGSDWQTRVIGEPLYTHPMRELTDEEIMEIYDRVELYNIDEGQMYLKPIEFAKELLKKASEK